MRRVEQLMGMPISIDIPDATDEKPFAAAFRRLQAIDKRFSPYKPASELCGFQSGKITSASLSAEMKHVIKACEWAEKLTHGYFSAYFSDKFDPTGYVKGWAIAEAGKVIEDLGFKTYCIGAGGDILARSDGKKTWNIGIQDPRDPKEILDMLSIHNGAVATSGNYERGAHIINPKTKKPAKELLSLTVFGPDIITADILATAAFAMGRAGEEFVNHQKGYKALAVAGEVI